MRIRKISVAALTVGGLLLGGVVPAGAAPVANASAAHAVVSDSAVHAVANKTSAKAPKYTDEEIVGLFVFGAGRAAVDHPDVVEKYVRGANPDVSMEVVADLTQQLLAANPKFYKEVTVPLQSGNPAKILDAQNVFNTTLKSIVQTGPSTGDGTPAGRCALFVAAAGAIAIVVAVVGGAVVQTLVAVNVNWVWAYTQPEDESEFTRQAQAAELAGKL